MKPSPAVSDLYRDETKTAVTVKDYQLSLLLKNIAVISKKGKEGR